MFRTCGFPLLMVVAIFLSKPSFSQDSPQQPNREDIRLRSQHFISGDNNTAPWIFFPTDNIKTLTTAEHRGYLMIRDAGNGKDIKGVFKDPIAIGKYPLPWEFQLGLLQHGAIDTETQANRVFGVNLRGPSLILSS